MHAKPVHEKETKPRAGKRTTERLARTLAHGTLLAAGIASAPFWTAERDPRFPLFDSAMVDRLRGDLTRFHE